jgi:hypothetical protein
MIQWLREDVSGTGWQPGNYSCSKFAEISDLVVLYKDLSNYDPDRAHYPRGII